MRNNKRLCRAIPRRHSRRDEAEEREYVQLRDSPLRGRQTVFAIAVPVVDSVKTWLNRTVCGMPRGAEAKSKRTSLKWKYTAEKRVRDAHRKQRRIDK